VSIYTFFTDPYIHRIFPDIIRINSRGAKAVLLYSAFIQQLIYIKVSDLKTPLKKKQMLLYNERCIVNIQRLIEKQYGKKRGNNLFNEADILIVLIVNKTCKSIYRLLQAINKLEKGVTYTRKHFFMVFDNSKKSDKEIASVVYKSLYHKFDNLIQAIEIGFQRKNIGRDKEGQVKPFDKVKERLYWLKHARDRSGKIYFGITSKALIPTKFKVEIDNEIFNIKNSKILKREEYMGVEMHH